MSEPASQVLICATTSSNAPWTMACRACRSKEGRTATRALQRVPMVSPPRVARPVADACVAFIGVAGLLRQDFHRRHVGQAALVRLRHAGLAVLGRHFQPVDARLREGDGETFVLSAGRQYGESLLSSS